MNKKTVFLTGAAGNLGSEIARVLAQENYTLILVDLPSKLEELEFLSEELIVRTNIVIETIDITDYLLINNAIDRLLLDYKIDILINCAGLNKPTTLLTTTIQDWDAIMKVNLYAPFFLMKILSKSMIKNKYGRIINIGSLIGQVGYPAAISYGSSKSGLIGLTKLASAELSKHNITCNVVAPGFLDTQFLNYMPLEWKESISSTLHSRRFGKVNEVANLVKFLASEESSYITGSIYNINGGII